MKIGTVSSWTVTCSSASGGTKQCTLTTWGVCSASGQSAIRDDFENNKGNEADHDIWACWSDSETAHQ
jgi:hypothetical protein